MSGLLGLIFLGSGFLSGTLSQQLSWDIWWSYDGVSGPDFWGIVRPEWALCTKGRRQSPVNINPSQLLYDPTLKHAAIDRHKVAAEMVNTGQDITILVDDKDSPVFLTDGGLSYKYTVSKIQLHFGAVSGRGSEHTVDGQAFPAEVQIYGYNSDLYGNMSHAETKNGGVSVISVMVQVTEQPEMVNSQLRMIIQLSDSIKHKEKRMKIGMVSVHGLLPDTKAFITYEGSLTQPGCHESVTWLVMNKPIYATETLLNQLREVQRSDGITSKVAMEDNYRPIRPLHGRVLRTNINFPKDRDECTMDTRTSYKANSRALKRRDETLRGRV